ncbi:hypothetical protein [Natronomonas sp.]|uniref:DUF7859 family protein n=1 Tax=Natronomonas sp. TaxID=2184060 RepID=UPI002630C6B8|nr:hypothetical protein [Natronomonas sp.]
MTPTTAPAALRSSLSMGFGVDPVLVGIITLILIVVFALFLFLRKTLLSFSEGVRDGKRGDR